jgi:ADP-ribose pyrophosphatase
MKSEIRHIKRSIACKNAKWNVFFDHISDGENEVVDYLVVEPSVKYENDITGIGTLPLKNGKIGLISVYRIAVKQVMWELPRGFIDPDEVPVTAAKRELIEETGLECSDENMIPLGTVVPESSTLAARMCLFAALDCSETSAVTFDEIGLGKIKYFSLAEIKQMVLSSEIEDASTCAALSRLFLLLESHQITIPEPS